MNLIYEVLKKKVLDFRILQKVELLEHMNMSNF